METKTKLKEICTEDNILQRKLNKGLITLEEFNTLKQKSHNEYQKEINEEDMLEKLMTKYKK